MSIQLPTADENSRLAQMTTAERQAENNTQAHEQHIQQTALAEQQADLATATINADLNTLASMDTNAFDSILEAHGIEKNPTTDVDLELINTIVYRLDNIDRPLAQSLQAPIQSEWQDIQL